MFVVDLFYGFRIIPGENVLVVQQSILHEHVPKFQGARLEMMKNNCRFLVPIYKGFKKCRIDLLKPLDFTVADVGPSLGTE